MGPKHGSRKTRTSKIKKKRPEGAVPDCGEAKGVARQGPQPEEQYIKRRDLEEQLELDRKIFTCSIA